MTNEQLAQLTPARARAMLKTKYRNVPPLPLSPEGAPGVSFSPPGPEKDGNGNLTPLGKRQLEAWKLGLIAQEHPLASQMLSRHRKASA